MKYILILFSTILVSMFFFPFEFTFFTGINTKHVMAGLGTLCFAWDVFSSRTLSFSKELLISSLIAVAFSMVGYYSTDYNHTTDYTYSTYIGSMWVWYLACYGVCSCLRINHRYLSIKLIVNYLVIVCVLQCIFALLIDFNLAFKTIVDSLFITGDRIFMEEAKRLYGIGASLDVAGVRFSTVLVMASVMLSTDKEIRSNNKYMIFYILGFLIIAVIGNMISRTTTIGVILGLSYIIFKSGLLSITVRRINLRFWIVLIGTMTFGISIVTYLYNTNLEVNSLLRFAFEGFFNWVETGEWETDSTETLKGMWILPDNMKTWIIGDGYFNKPFVGGYYKGTDVGYLRFIYYSGLIGLFFFSLFFVYLSFALGNRFSYVKNMFLLLLVVALVNWIKVSTDIFLVYAFFLVLSQPYFLNSYYKKDFEPI